MKNQEIKIGELVDRYRYWIGGVLVVMVVMNAAYLLYRENYLKPDTDDRIAQLEDRMQNLESGIKNQESSSSPQVQTAEESNIAQPMTQTVDQKSPSSDLTGVALGAQTASQEKEIAAVSGLVNLNTATLGQLDSLPGIGTSYAQRIVDYRDSHGGFKAIEEVMQVKGIGEKTFEKFKDKVTVQ